MTNNSIFALNTPISKQEALALHPMALAFVGDAVQSLYTRTRVTVGSNQKTGALHHEVIKVVKRCRKPPRRKNCSRYSTRTSRIFSDVQETAKCKRAQNTPK